MGVKRHGRAESDMASAPEAATVPSAEWPEPEQCAVDVDKVESEKQEHADEGARARGEKGGGKGFIGEWKATCILL